MLFHPAKSLKKVKFQHIFYWEGRGYRNAEGSHSFLPAIVPRDGPSGWTGLSSKNLLVARLLVLYSVWHREEPEVHNSLLQEWFATGPCVLCGRVCPGPGNSDCHWEKLVFKDMKCRPILESEEWTNQGGVRNKPGLEVGVETYGMIDRKHTVTGLSGPVPRTWT